MLIDATRAVRPLVDFVDRIDIPLFEFLETGAAPILDEIMVAVGAEAELTQLPRFH